MKAADIMVSNVITVSPDHSVQDVAEILLKNGISGVPVVDAGGKLVGILSEGDLMRCADAGTEHHRSWWLRLFLGREGLAGEYIKEHSRKVADVMTRHVMTASPDASIGDIAEMLERNGIKRVPIMQGGKIVGIVSRANLLQALAGIRNKISFQKNVADSALRASVLNRLRAEPWTRTSLLNVTVHDGIVDLWGVVDSATEKKALCVAAEVTPGVRTVNDGVIVRPVASGT